MGVVNFVHKVENSEGGEGNYNKNNGGENGSNDFDLLGVKDVAIGQFGGNYRHNNVKY